MSYKSRAEQSLVAPQQCPSRSRGGKKALNQKCKVTGNQGFAARYAELRYFAPKLRRP
jgi:hypothetical protein